MSLRRWLSDLQHRLERRAERLAAGRELVQGKSRGAAGDADGEALMALRRAAVQAPNDPQAALALAQGLAQGGRAQEASERARAAVAVAQRMDDWDAELAACTLWQSLEPGAPEPSIARARALAAAGRAPEAAAAYEAVLAEHGSRADVLMRLGSVYHDMVRAHDALRVWLQAVELEPGNVDALCVAGLGARDAGDTALAESLLLRAQAAAPDSSHAVFNLGLVRLDQGRLAEASAAFGTTRALTRGEPWGNAGFEERMATCRCNPADRDWGTSRFKLGHDIEQLEYLRARGKLGPAYDAVLQEYRYALTDRLLPEDPYSMVALDPRRYPLLAATYKRPLFVMDPDPPEGPLVNPDLPWAQIEERYFDTRPGMVTIDGLLTAPALAAVRAWCLESTVWNELKGGYLGAYMHDGFSARLLLQVAAELRERMPRVIRDRPLQTMWAYKYDPRYSGTGLHADVAAVNVNFWITPDEANLDPDSGGLVVYTHEAPRDWGFQRFNVGHEEIRAFLDAQGSGAVRVPYRENRALLFDSDLFHETDAFRFREGYANRRINITMLYGTREAAPRI